MVLPRPRLRAGSGPIGLVSDRAQPKRRLYKRVVLNELARRQLAEREFIEQHLIPHAVPEDLEQDAFSDNRSLLSMKLFEGRDAVTGLDADVVKASIRSFLTDYYLVSSCADRPLWSFGRC